LTDKTSGATDVSSSLYWGLIVLVPLILVLGVYPAPLLDLAKESVDYLIQLKR